ncbi:ABC transporter permease [Paralcaligenes sp. KSB-10]|jgi:cell division transport system permease protein|uniref:cell division protein FtsX n=1 Tax=Paralcaligenes sp. KSB-10 TaxID=2901142 RepID=UPI001E480F8B|nr:ABC transporter permease [Paralcaligenes sp. KSB-10]UHL62828.1 ABC transporter permease [Paralcaligenes sp. KSB-10]
MTRWLRQHRYALLVAIRRLLAQPFSSLSNLLVIALTLALPIIGASVLVSAQPVARQVSVSPEVTLFLKPNAPANAGKKVLDRIQAEYQREVQAVRLVPRQQALQQLKSNPSWADALSVLQSNPLPDAVVITLKDGADLAQHASSLAQEWRRWDQIDAVQLDSAWVQRLEAILQFVRIGLGLLAIGVALVVLATVFNTVRMQALTQREEIGVARLVGATESFVRRPFLYLGALTGVVASLIAVLLSALALIPLNAALARLAQSYGTSLSLHLPDGLSLGLAVIVVAILGALSARWSVTRSTRF